jgi:hypothetical protein
MPSAIIGRKLDASTVGIMVDDGLGHTELFWPYYLPPLMQ